MLSFSDLAYVQITLERCIIKLQYHTVFFLDTLQKMDLAVSGLQLVGWGSQLTMLLSAGHVEEV